MVTHSPPVRRIHSPPVRRIAHFWPGYGDDGKPRPAHPGDRAVCGYLFSRPIEPATGSSSRCLACEQWLAQHPAETYHGSAAGHHHG